MSWSISMLLLGPISVSIQMAMSRSIMDILVEIGVNDGICKHSFILKSLMTHPGQFQESCSD